MMKHLLTYLTFFLLISYPIIAQDWVWGLKATGDHQHSGDIGIAIANDGNAVIAGYFQKSLILDGQSLYTSKDYYSDMYLGGVNPEGHLKWLISIDAGSTYNENIGIALDDDKNIYLTGSKDGYIFVSKYDSVGRLIWNNNFDNKYYGYGKDIALDQFDNVYVIGDGGWNFFLAKLDFYGKTAWLKNIWVNYSAGFNTSAIEVDAMGNAYFAGHFGIDSIKLDDIEIKQKGSAFWGKIDANGKFLWAKAAKGHATGNTQLALTSNNEMYLSGSFAVSLTIDNTVLNGLCCSDPKTYITKYDTNGNFIWAKTTVGEGSTSDIKVDYNGNLYLAGNNFDCYGVFCTEYDYYLEKYDPSASLIWRKDFRHHSFDLSRNFDLDNNGFLYVTASTLAKNAIDEKSISAINSLAIGKLNTLSTTTKRTARPLINRVFYYCSENEVMSLHAKGQNIKWYDTPDLSYLVHTGERYERHFQATDTIYVTQTINNVESWPKEVIVYRVDLNNETLKYNKDTLSVNPNPLFNYQWMLNDTVIPNSNTSYWLPQLNGKYSVEIQAGNCSKTLDYIYKRPSRPETDSLKFICYKETLGKLIANGENVVWYADQTYNDTLFVGNQYNANISANTTLYVRQTVNEIASYPQKVMVKFSELKDSVMKYGPSKLFVTYSKSFKYQWYYEDTLIEEAKSSEYSPTKNGLYKVSITDSLCTKLLSRYFVSPPKISKTTYAVCSTDSMPTITAEGNNLSWVYYNSENHTVDTLSRSNSYTPTFNKSHLIYLTQNENGYSSYPVYINIFKANFSKLTFLTSDYMVGFEGNDVYQYSYQWFINDEPNPVFRSPQVYDPYFGRYKIKVSLGDNCDTIFNFSYYPKYDSIHYICNNNNPVLSVNSNNIRWFSDSALTKVISYGTTMYPYLNGIDSTFYIAQFLNNKVIWKGKVKVIFPQLNQLEIINNYTALVVNNPKPYYSYKWFYEGIPLKDIDYYCKPDKNGSYSVEIQAGNCMINISYPYINTSVIQINTDKLHHIYPNPTIGILNIISNVETDKNIHVKLYSSAGQIVQTNHSNCPKMVLNIGDLASGIYFIEISTEVGTSVYKITKL